MVAAARWIAKLATPVLKKALGQYPDYKLKIVGHSLGGGTAALLTYVLREQKELSMTSCVAFAPAACMTWELAQSGNDFITSVINGADLVPTFSAAAVDDLRAEVTASAWLNDLRNQIERTRILSTVYRSASALGSRLPSISSARAKVAGAGAILRPVSNGTQVVMRRAQSMAQAAWTTRPSLRLSSWSCIGPRHRDEMPKHMDVDAHLDGGEDFRSNTHEDQMNEIELWKQLEHELYDRADGEDADVAKEIREEEAVAMAEVGESESASTAQETKEVHRFFPPGKIMHIVTLQLDSAEPESEGDSPSSSDSENTQSLGEAKVGIFVTPRSLYSKLRLSQTMISDHLMPVYRRQIEKLIKELEQEATNDNHYSSETVVL
ncbi:hypothetical protein GH714_036407 [Hevea brasiliensis]|uniref:Fungal lipase-type domain-containing protein n=1 Tax=Hevea brasiliensis TaxID=3981 RepID=A0A6A6NEQ9_HEVBR|nr:hypothetical protein GH714_036407 [Hevea brasiliensis]